MEFHLMHEDGRRLHSLAQVLKSNGMPQETINMVLAAKCGMPMQKVDGKSTYYRWTEDAEPVEPAPTAAPEKPNPSALAWDIVGTLGEMELVEGLSVLAMAANNFAGPYRYAARIVISENLEVAG